MAAERVSLAQYTDFAQADHDRGLLHSAGVQASVRQQPEENSEAGYVLLLEVPRTDVAKAGETLRDYYESEKDEGFEFMGDWAEEENLPGEPEPGP